MLSMISEALKSIKSEQSLLQYLDSLMDLKGCTYLQALRRATRLNLQVHLLFSMLLVKQFARTYAVKIRNASTMQNGNVKGILHLLRHTSKSVLVMQV